MAIHQILLDPSRQLALLQSGPPKSIPRKDACYQIAIALLNVFGPRYAQAVLEKLEGKLKEHFCEVYTACVEIRNQLKKGNHNDQLWPETSRVSQCIGGHRGHAVHALKMASCSLVAFPQEMFPGDSNLESGTFDQSDFEYEGGFDVLTRYMSPQDLADHKGSDSLGPADELSMAILCFRRGALIFKGEVYYFSDMIHMWADLCPEERDSRITFFQKVPGKEWIQVQWKKAKDLIDFDPSIDLATLPFKTYLALSSLAAVSENFKVPLLPSVQEELVKRFLKLESTRSDVCYFSAHTRVLYELDLTRFHRSSKVLLRTFQFYLFLAGFFRVPNKELPALLSILIFMRFDLDKIDLAGFRVRKWNPKPSERVSAEEVESFWQAWSALQRTLTLIARREVFFSSPTEEDEQFLSDPDCWNVLFFLWTHPSNREVFVTFFERLAKIPDFALTLSSILGFCECNEAFTEEQAECFLTVTRLVGGILLQHEIALPHPESLFFSPPYHFASIDVEIYYGYAEGQAKIFLERVAPHRFEGREEDLCVMTRDYIVFPQPSLFGLVEDCQEMGAQPNEKFFIHVFTKKYPLCNQISNEVRGIAKDITQEIVEGGDFSDVEIFDLYVAVLAGILRGPEQVQGVKRAILILQSFCPHLSPQSCMFLITYPSEEIVLSHANCLKEAHEDWVRDEDEDLDRFVINQGKYAAILQEIRRFAELLSAVCPPDLENIGLRFCESLKLELFSAFYMSQQPLSDFLNLRSVSSDRVELRTTHLKTHEGQLLSFNYSDVKLYLNWQVFNDRPVLYIFYKQREKTASAFLVLDVSANEVSDVEIGGPFCGLLGRLAQEVLPEEANQVPDAAEQPEPWVSAYTGASDTITNSGLGSNFVGPVQRFLSDLKRQSRKLYLRVVASPPPQNFPEDQEELAALGHIFEFDDKMSLLPQDHGAHPEHFNPDAEPALIEAKRALFSQSTLEPQPLELNLRTTDGDFPISYHVQSKGEFINDPLDEGNEAGKYVTLSCGDIRIPLRYSPEVLEDPTLFAWHFKFHNLLVKTAYYFKKTMD